MRRSLGNRETRTIKLEVSLGQQIQDRYSEVGEMFLSGISQRKIAKHLQNNGLARISSLRVLEHGVRYALSGNGDSQLGEVYGGLIPRDEYESQVAQNKKVSGEQTGKLMVENGRGVHSLTTQELSEASRKSAIARGQTPWTEEEIWRAMQLEENPDHKYRGKKSNKRIAETLGNRSTYAVAEMFRRLNPEKRKAIKEKYAQS